jgi:hypothetical protein
MSFVTLPFEMVGSPERPKCQVPGCNRNAHVISKLENWSFRKSSWVMEKYGVRPGYCCSRHHDEHYGRTIGESFFER